MPEQPMPKPTDGPSLWDLVISDMRSRDALGRRRYETPVQAFNGRDAILDATEEALDLVVYLRQHREELKELALALRYARNHADEGSEVAALLDDVFVKFRTLVG